MQDRVLGDVSWTRGKCPKHECHPQQADVHGFEIPARTKPRSQNGGAVLFLLKAPRAHALLSMLRPAQCRRWASADLSHGPAYKSRPGTFTRQGPNRGSELRRRVGNVSSREVSKGVGSTARCRPNLSITSPYESIDDSTCRPPLTLSKRADSTYRQPLKADCRFSKTQPFVRSF